MKYIWLILAVACALSSEVRADDRDEWLDLVRTIAARRGSEKEEPEELRNLLNEFAATAQQIARTALNKKEALSNEAAEEARFITVLLHDRRQAAEKTVREDQIRWLETAAVPAFPSCIREKFDKLCNLPELPQRIKPKSTPILYNPREV